MLRVLLLASLAMRARTEPDECDGVVDCARQYAADVVDTVETFGQEFMNNRINDMREAGADGIADTAQAVQDTLFPAETVTISSNSISGDENGVCDEDDESGSCGAEEDPDGPDYEEDLDDVEYAEDEEAEEDEEFDEEEFFENDDGGDDEEEEVDDNDDGTNGDGEYDRRSELEQLKDPRFDQLEWAGHRRGRSSSGYKFDLRESRRGRAFGGRSRTDRVLFCMSKTTNKRDAIDIVGDFGEGVRSEWTHRESIGVAIGQGSRNWARAQTHGETVVALNLMLGIKNVNDEKINLADDRSSHAYDVRTLGRLVDFGMVEQDSESLELRPGPKMKCVWATGLKSFTLADSLTFSMDVALAGGHSNTDNNIMKQYDIVDINQFYTVELDKIMGRVDGGDLKEGLQLRLMDPSTGEPYSEWYKFTGSEIVKIIQTNGGPQTVARLSLEIPAARQMTKDAVYLATGLDAPDGLRAGTELEPWVPHASNLFVVFKGGFKRSGNRGRYVSNEGTLFCNIGVQYYTFDGSTLLLDKGSEPEMTDQTLTAARDVRDAFIGEHISRGHADETYLERVHGRDRERDDARDAEPLPPPSKRRWVPKQSWEAYARGEREPRPTPRPTPRPRGPPSLATKRDPVEDLRGLDLYGFDKAFRVLYTEKVPKSGGKTEQWNKLALAAFEYLSEYEDEGPEDGSFEGIEVRSELKARAEGVDVFFYDKDQGTPFDEGVEVRAYWTRSTIYLAPHADEENAVARGEWRGIEGRSGHAYALVKLKAGGGRRDFEFANYPGAFLIVARD